MDIHHRVHSATTATTNTTPAFRCHAPINVARRRTARDTTETEVHERFTARARKTRTGQTHHF